MARRQRGETHRLTLRVPEAVYQDFLALAAVLHTDAGALMTQKLIALHPAVRRELREHQAALGETNGQEAEKA